MVVNGQVEKATELSLKNRALLIYEDKAHFKGSYDTQNSTQTVRYPLWLHVFPRRTKKRTNIDELNSSALCAVRFISASTLKPRVEIIFQKVNSINRVQFERFFPLFLYSLMEYRLCQAIAICQH